MANKTKPISFRRYYFWLIVINVIMALLWAGMTVYERSAFAAEHSGITVTVWIVFVLLAFATITASTVISARHDKFDELYRENVNRTNSSFLKFLFWCGFILFLCCQVTQNIGVPLVHLSGGIIAATMYLLYAIYNGIAMHYERTAAEGMDA